MYPYRYKYTVARQVECCAQCNAARANKSKVAAAHRVVMGRKIVVKAEEFGSLDFATATEIVTVDVPTPGADELVLKVSATGIEASDVIREPPHPA
jgi:hypothetical protein